VLWSAYLANEDATIEAGRTFGALLGGGAVVFLEGCLGAGKTTFSRGILSAFGHSGVVKSPTYTLVEPYHFAGTSVFHFDLYRLGDPEELEYLGIRDYFDGQAVCVIEWPEKGRGYIPGPDLVVNLNPQQEGRKLDVESKTDRGEKVLTLLTGEL